jgi:hypothetical protein
MNGCPVTVRLALRTHSELWPKIFFDYSYQPGDMFDRIVEAFGGPHDFIGGQMTGLYDGQGDIRRGMSNAERWTYDNLLRRELFLLLRHLQRLQHCHPGRGMRSWL